MYSTGLLLLAGLVGLALGAVKHELHTICVPTTVIKPCEHLVEQALAVGMVLKCLPARDRVDCIYKVKEHKADFEAVEPEDMYLAGQLADKSFSVFMEIRSKEEKSAKFRYEAVAVVHKDLDINNPKALKGLKSCHTGIGRNAGYKIPLTKLTKMGILGPLSDTSASPRENELEALSKFFSKGCLVGTWSPHPETNTRLKHAYSNLCELCEDPVKCDYPDANSGYEGALRCLAKGGDVAWTKVIFVKKFFGMPYGNQSAKPSEYNPDDYAYFCPDGSKRPVTGPPCSWAARPWPGFISANHIEPDEIEELREEIIKLNNLAISKHADWIAKVLLMNNKTVAVNNDPNSPIDYLEKAKYKDVIERDVLQPKRVVRLCVETSTEMEKCELLKAAAYSRDIRPSLACVRSDNCIHAVSQKEAEVVVLDAHEGIHGESHGLKPLLNEQYNGKNEQDIVAVVPENSIANSMSDLKGKRACLPQNKSASFFGVLKSLKDNGLISTAQCPYENSFSEFFSSTTQSWDPIKCLEEQKGDVAFVPWYSLQKDDENKFQLMCPTGGKSPVEATGCELVAVPPKIIMVSDDLSAVQVEEVVQTFLSAGELYGENPSLFRLFGDFKGVPNVIFSNHATKLAAITGDLPSYEAYKTMVSAFSCKA